MHVDPCFGGDAAFRRMVEALHREGLRVIIDGVFNHCGWRFPAFEDVVRNQKSLNTAAGSMALSSPLSDRPTRKHIPHMRPTPTSA